MNHHVKNLLLNWSGLFFILALIFIVWSLRLVFSVNSMHREIGVNAALINNIAGIGQSLHGMDKLLSQDYESQDADSLNHRWAAATAELEKALAAMRGLPELSPDILRFSSHIDSSVKAVSRAFESHLSMRGNETPPIGALQDWRAALACAMDSSSVLMTHLRTRPEESSLTLSGYGSHLTALVTISCVLALLTAVLLALYIGKTGKYRRLLIDKLSVQKELERISLIRSELFSRVILQLSEVVTKLNQVVDKQTMAMQEQSVALNQTTTTAQEIAVTAQQTTQKAEQVSENAEQSRSVTGKSKSGVDSAIQAMETIQANIKETLEHIIYLNDKTKQIDTITTSVKDISKKTNILALNASIEATKAGTAGRGLTIVAHEVQALAEKSQRAAQEISDLIQEVRHSAEATQTSIQSGYRTIETHFTDIKDAGDMMDKSIDMLTENESYAKEILIDSKQQAIGIDQMTEALSSINSVMQQIVLGTDEIRLTLQSVDKLTAELQDATVTGNGHKDT